MAKTTIHLLPNAHIDPVWMWDWSEGLCEGVRTCRTILNLLDEYPELTFLRGETAIYEHVEQYDPETFQRISQYIASGRWEPVGGQYVQPDNNMPSTWTALRQFEIGCRYFREKFNYEIRIGWLADAFGHGRGTPEIFTAAGMRYFAFTRPQQNICPIDAPLFRWAGQGGSELLCLRSPGGIYGSERSPEDTTFPTRVIERVIQEQQHSFLPHLAIPFGLGDHGGGPSRRHIDAILEWRDRHPEVEVRFSTWRDFFACAEQYRDQAPLFTGEVNFCQRGCYSSTVKFKHLYRTAENQLSRAAKVNQLLTGKELPEELSKGICFNSFHDILPGTIIESALHQQMQWLGGLVHHGRQFELDALFRLGRKLDTTVPEPEADDPETVPCAIFNHRPYPYRGLMEIEISLDWRPLWKYRKTADDREPFEVRDSAGRLLPFQRIEAETRALVQLPPWRYRVLFPVVLPPSGWEVVTLGYCRTPGWPSPGFVQENGAATAEGDFGIANSFYRVEAHVGSTELQLFHRGKPLPVEFALFDDPTGSWGDMSELPENSHALTRTESWTISEVKVLERGPLRSTLWVRFSGKRSRIELRLRLSAGREAVDISARISWLDRSRRLKMLLPQGQVVDYDVPGGLMRRGETAQVPGGRHQRVYPDGPDREGFAVLSDTFYGFENEGGHFAVILARGCRYSTDELANADDYHEHPVADHGELLGELILTTSRAPVEEYSEMLEQPPVCWFEAPHAGELPRRGSLGFEVPDSRLKWIDGHGGKILLQNRSDREISWENRTFPPWKITAAETSWTPPLP